VNRGLALRRPHAGNSSTHIHGASGLGEHHRQVTDLFLDRPAQALARRHAAAPVIDLTATSPT
jgi:hypothetical protein